MSRLDERSCGNDKESEADAVIYLRIQEGHLEPGTGNIMIEASRPSTNNMCKVQVTEIHPSMLVSFH